MDASTVSPELLQQELALATAPIVVDVRTPEDFERSEFFVQGALRRPQSWILEWAKSVPEDRSIVAYCSKGGSTGRGAAEALASTGRPARSLEGGIALWKESGGAVLPKPAGSATRWVTRERPKIDRIACPWLVSRFIDRDAEFLYVPKDEVRSVAEARRAIPYDIPDVLFSHDGELCSFDAFLKVFRLDDPGLRVLAAIVRGADTGHLELAPEAAGLLALSLGLSRLRNSDDDMRRDGFVMYDALYLWAREGRQETHTWNPDLYR